ncbi:hypothetical protein F7R91_02660 [Streptomyces luteolifulvus]|uniref:Uncharacterized protein n=1 Tax=Streptomyces luteolifulvus TaxID=2615112 RepID=A0A6H9VA05_9ACTN|nr:hypothetical protein [Streptomyces luteolifulvus]KAB1149764.1 hypothetical protein F7R91_02660 [Streptomyces luteolifulvus]
MSTLLEALPHRHVLTSPATPSAPLTLGPGGTAVVQGNADGKGRSIRITLPLRPDRPTVQGS